LCREAKSSIVSIATGEPVGEPETLFDSNHSNLWSVVENTKAMPK
jgi:hypothetical protein